MTERSQVSDGCLTGREGRCSACGQPAAELVNGCCALCGHRHDVDGTDVTSEDNTPYSQALTAGHRGWRAMCGWVYGAGKSRLMHLGLMRPSPASRRFARINLLLFSFALAAAVFANTGWHLVLHGTGAPATTMTPVGKGWAHIAERGHTLRAAYDDEVLATDLWWNLPRAIVSAGIVLPTVLLLAVLLLWVVGARGQKAMRSGGRENARLRCAVHYSTAWIHFISLAALIELGRPVATIIQVRGWSKLASTAIVDVPAVLIGLVGVLMWWFWLIRLGDTAPRDVRRLVNRHFVLWMPLWVMGIGGAAVFGLYATLPHLAAALNLNW